MEMSVNMPLLTGKLISIIKIYKLVKLNCTEGTVDSSTSLRFTVDNNSNTSRLQIIAVMQLLKTLNFELVLMNLNIGLYKQQHNSLENEAITGLMISRSSIFSHLQCGFSLALSLLDRFRACHVLKVERPKPDNFAKSLQIKRHTQYYLNLSLGFSVERDNSRKRARYGLN